MNKLKLNPKITGYTFVKNPKRETLFLKKMLWLNAILGSILFIYFSIIFFLNQNINNQTVGVWYFTVMNVVRMGGVIIFIITGVSFLKWIYWANVNVRGFGAVDITHSAGWAIGSYFVPIVNLIVPYRAMRDIWAASCSPERWREVPTSSLLRWWWALWLINTVVSNVPLIGVVFYIILCIVAVCLVDSIYRKQQELVGDGQPVTSTRVSDNGVRAQA